MANPMLDDEDSQDNEDTNYDAVQPIQTPVADRNALRAMLMQKIQQADRGQAFDAKDSTRKIDSGLSGTLALNQALAKAAAQVGTVAGKTASTEPIDEFTQATMGAQAKSSAADQAQQAERDKLNQYLVGRLSAQDVAATKGDTAVKIAETKGKTATDVAAAGADKNRYERTDLTSPDGNALVLDKRTGKLVLGPEAVKVGGNADGSNPKDNKRLDDLGNMLTTGGRNAADFKNHQHIVTNADKILQMEPQMQSQAGGLDKRQIEEISIASANLLSSGTGAAQATIQALVPHTYGSDSAGLKEWLSSDPQGTNQQAFVNRMFETAKREKQLASEKIKGYRADMLGTYSDLADNDRYNKLKGKYFGPDDKFDENGNYQMKPFAVSSPSPQQPGAQGGSGMAVGAPGANQIPKPQKPRTVIQNGHTYTLNPNTGEYE